ncbi:MAG: NADP-dependent malic enzyme [Candidatus Diapherotrites archaeon]|nr:NADP-dependent malic enzyme [Candidatus Diapherotrites archaeon]
MNAQDLKLKRRALEYHSLPFPGKIGIRVAKPLKNKADLALAYTPGVAHACLEIREHPSRVWDYTSKSNTIAIVTDGSRILGLGDIGPEAGLPVMEGKSMLYKWLGDVNAVPICIKENGAATIIEMCKLIQPSFGCIHLEDIKAPKCFEVLEVLEKELEVPVFHDDNQGTGMAVLAGLLNALKLARKDLGKAKIVMNGAGAAGTGITRLLLAGGAQNVIVLDSQGAIYAGRPQHMDEKKTLLASATNPNHEEGSLAQIIQGADVFIGASQGNILTPAMVQSMNSKAIVFALANPTPEIEPGLAKKAGAFIVATGSSLYENQVNNSVVFPGFMRGVLDCRAKRITLEMMTMAAHGIAEMIPRPGTHAIIPSSLEPKVAARVARRTVEAALKQGVAQTNPGNGAEYEKKVIQRIGKAQKSK